MESIKKGSVEALLVPLRDRLGNVDDLSTLTNLRFDTKKKEDDTAVQSDVAVVIDPAYPMTALCEITTTNALYVVDKEYCLYLKFTNGTESPVLGPVFFRVVGD